MVLGSVLVLSQDSLILISVSNKQLYFIFSNSLTRSIYAPHNSEAVSIEHSEWKKNHHQQQKKTFARFQS